MDKFVDVKVVVYDALVIATAEATRKTFEDFKQWLDSFVESCDCHNDMLPGLEQITHINLAIEKDLKVAATSEEKEVHEEKDTTATPPMSVMDAAVKEK